MLKWKEVMIQSFRYSGILKELRDRKVFYISHRTTKLRNHGKKGHKDYVTSVLLLILNRFILSNIYNTYLSFQSYTTLRVFIFSKKCSLTSKVIEGLFSGF